MSSPHPPYQLPGDGFTIWTRPSLGLEARPPAHYPCLGRQFTVWTRSLQPIKAPTPVRVPAAPHTAPVKIPWGRAALMALPIVFGVWIFDHHYQSTAAQEQAEQKQRQAETNLGLQGILGTMTKEMEEKSASLETSQTKLRELETQLAQSRLKHASAEGALQRTSEELKSTMAAREQAKTDMVALKKRSSDQMAELTNASDALRAEVTRLKQDLAQKEADFHGALAKLEAAKAAAINEAATAATQVRELTAKLGQQPAETPAPKP